MVMRKGFVASTNIKREQVYKLVARDQVWYKDAGKSANKWAKELTGQCTPAAVDVILGHIIALRKLHDPDYKPSRRSRYQQGHIHAK